MSQRWNKPREIELPPELAQAQQDINENFDRLFLALRRSPIGGGDGVLPVDNGGTGLGSVPVGDLLVGQGTPILALLPDVELGYALISGGVGAAPTYGKINLVLHVIGVLPIANGGTAGATALAGFNNLSPLTTKGDLLARDATNNIRVPVGADGRFLKANSAVAAGVEWGEGVAPHELLEEAVHTDAETATRVLGDMISALAPAETATSWIDGLLSDLLPTELDTTGEDYWIDGEPYDGISLGASGEDVKWRRLPIGSPGQVLKSNGTHPEWGDAGDVGEIVASAQPKARAYATSSVSIASGAGSHSPSYGGTRVEMTAESFDTDAFHDNSSNPARMTVPAGKGGVYLIVAQASWETSATGRKACWIVKNSNFRLGIQEVNGDDGGLNLSMTVTCFAELVEGDYVELHVRQDTGGALFSLGGVEADGLSSIALYKLP